ncbi:hypothetical protein [Neorhodopirellula pilleata]|uniref:hypothetical protein n=1 Tax=Neorhodopirellula pilleata TaxID=2714738 RepID=UPI001E4C78C4|nr:hypothetical protein [Neorhodopirellula pilleata]
MNMIWHDNESFDVIPICIEVQNGPANLVSQFWSPKPTLPMTIIQVTMPLSLMKLSQFIFQIHVNRFTPHHLIDRPIVKLVLPKPSFNLLMPLRDNVAGHRIAEPHRHEG